MGGIHETEGVAEEDLVLGGGSVSERGGGGLDLCGG